MEIQIAQVDSTKLKGKDRLEAVRHNLCLAKFKYKLRFNKEKIGGRITIGTTLNETSTTNDMMMFKTWEEAGVAIESLKTTIGGVDINTNNPNHKGVRFGLQLTDLEIEKKIEFDVVKKIWKIK